MGAQSLQCGLVSIVLCDVEQTGLTPSDAEITSFQGKQTKVPLFCDFR